jgi:Ca2+:H+ antiporter
MKIKNSPKSRFEVQGRGYFESTFPVQDRAPQPSTGMIARLSVAWITVALFLLFGGAWLGDHTPVWQAAGLFLWLFAVIMWSSFGCVKEADSLADLLGEPLGSLALALAIITIEAVLIGAVVLGSNNGPTMGRDTIYAANMIMINAAGGLALLLGGLHHKEQEYNLQGAAASLAVIIPLAVIGLILPGFTHAQPRGSVTPIQAGAIAVLTIFLYIIFLLLQIGRHKHFFTEVRSEPAGEGTAAVNIHQSPKGSVRKHTLLLLAGILPIILLSGNLAKLIDRGIALLNAPSALGGVLIALLVVSPKAISAVAAGIADQPMRAVNLALGSCAPAIGLTVPVVLGIGIVAGKTIIMGLDPGGVVLLALTLLVSALTFSGPRTTLLEGAAHLVIFFMYIVLIFSP